MGRAGGGSSGGGHSSSGHSSSRSSGGHSMSHSRAGSSSSHSRSGSSYHSSSSYSSPNHYSSHNHYGNTYINNGGYYNQPRMGHEPRTSGTSSLVSLLIWIAIIAIFFYVFITLKPGQPNNSRNRDKLTDVPAFNADCVVDELYWFDNINSAGSKLKEFYKKTGIQPYVYLKAYDSTLRSEKDKEAYANQLFDELGLTESTFLYVYFAEPNQDEDVGYMCYVNGKMVDSIMDNEAIDIFWGYVDKYWYTDMSTDELFSKIFSKTAETIMVKSKTFADVAITIVIGGAIVAGLCIVYVIMKTKRKHEAERAKETERILNSSMQDLVKGSESDPLVDKYN